MRAVRYRMSRALRAQWRTTAVVSLVVAAVTGVVLAFATGADRTASAPDRYTSASGFRFDGEVRQESGRPRTSEVEALPGVASVDAVTFVFGGLALPGGDPAPDALVFAGSSPALGMRLADGRQPDPASTGEFIASRSYAESGGVAVGTRFDVLTLTQEQVDRAGFGAFFDEGAQGPSVEAVLVGIVDGPADLNDPTPFVVLPPTLLENADVGIASTIMSVRLRPGTDLAALRAQLDTLPDGGTLALEPSEVVSAEVRKAVDGQALGLWLLTAVGAVATVVVLGQLITRGVRLSGEEAPGLAALGFTKGQLLAESVGRAAVPILAGTMLGAAVATGLSTAFPIGFVARIEPDQGVLVDPTVLVLCAAALLVALLLWTLVALVVAKPARGAVRPSALVESVATRCGSAALSTGIRFAFTRSRRDRGTVAGALAGMLVTAALLVGAVVFGSSLGRLVTDGSRFGNNFDLITGSGGDAVPDDLLATLESDPDVSAVMLYAISQGRVGPVSMGLAGMEPIRGNLVPEVVAGRLPSTDDEIALGRLVAGRLGVGVGDDLTIEGAQEAGRFRVTGLAVVPGVEGLDGVGQDAVVTLGGLRRLDPEAQPTAAAVNLRPGAPADTPERLGIGGGNSNPIVIENLARIRSIPYLLAWLVGALAVLTVVHVMVASVYNRRRDVAVLRSLGADRRWVTRAVHWQATTFSLVPLVLGAPLGLMVGRLVFETFAGSVGAVPGASVPFARIAAVIVGMAVLANVAAAVPAGRARRLEPAPLLTAE